VIGPADDQPRPQPARPRDRTGGDVPRGPHSCATLRLDLSRVTFVDCATIGVLIGLNRDAAEPGARVAITAASPIVDQLLTLFDLGAMFDYPPPAVSQSPAKRRRWWRPRHHLPIRT
jgi:STAS domain